VNRRRLPVPRLLLAFARPFAMRRRSWVPPLPRHGGMQAPVCATAADAIGAPVCAFPFSSCLDPAPHAPVVDRPPAIVRDVAAGEEGLAAVGGETGVVGAVLGGGEATAADGGDAGAAEAATAVLTAMKEMK